MKNGNLLKLACLPAFLAVSLAQPAETRKSALPEGAIVHRDIAYVSNGHERQKLDLYLPKDGTNLPLIIYIHGGAFRMGSKEQGVPTEYLARGFAVASINYRLSQHAKFPAQIEDCKAAVRWLRAYAARFRLDPNRFAAWGPSAGGHLAAMLGTTGDVKEFDVGENLVQSSRVQAVVDYFGPTDFLQMDAHRLPNGMIHDTPDSPESQLIGGAIQENKDKAAKANPVNYVTPDDPPFLIVHGDSDPLVPHHQSELLEAALKKAGVPVTFYTVKGGGHGGFRDPKVPELTQDFLNKHLQNAKEQPQRSEKNRRISGIYPHLAVFNNSGECGLGAWHNASVRAGIPSDPCLVTGYDNKKLILSHSSREPVTFRVQADFTGAENWVDYTTLTVSPGKTLTYQFPDAFGAYWLRIVADKDTTATATFMYD